MRWKWRLSRSYWYYYNHFYPYAKNIKLFIKFSDENVIGLSLQEILPDNNNIKAEKMLVANPPNILKRSKSLKIQNAVSIHKTIQKQVFDEKNNFYLIMTA